MGRLLIFLMLSFSLSLSPVYAQAPPPNGELSAEETTYGPRKQLATIIFSGLAGAVLGLSTLSFYGRPQDKLSNIAIGFAIGIIGGTAYTTYKTATRPYDNYNDSSIHSPENFQYYADVEFQKKAKPQIGLSYQWSFD